MRYKAQSGGRAFILTIFGFFVIVGLFVVRGSRSGHGPPMWFTAIWLAVLAWNAHSVLWRTAVEYEVADGALRWRSPLTGGTIDVRTIRRVSSQGRRGGLTVEHDGGRPVRLGVGSGLASLGADLREARPDLPIQ